MDWREHETILPHYARNMAFPVAASCSKVCCLVLLPALNNFRVAWKAKFLEENMCNFASGILTKDKEFWCDTSDSHEDIIQKHGLHEDGAQGPNLLKYELLPPVNGENLFSLAEWEFKIDQDIKPEWVKGNEEERARAAFLRRFPDFGKRKLSADGSLNLSSLTTLPADAKLSVGGDLYLRNLTSLPANAKLSAGGNLDLRNLTKLPANAKLSVGGSLDLSGLTTLPANAKLSVGGYLDLRNLTKLPANAKLSAGGGLNLSSLTTLPADAKLSAGGNLYLINALQGKELPAGITIKGRVIYY
jgi:hypothetical protein